MSAELRIATLTESDLSRLVREAVESYVTAKRRAQGQIHAGEDEAAPLLLTYQQAAEAMSVSAVTVRRMASRGEIPVVRLGKSTRIPARWLESWVEEQTRQAEAEVQAAAEMALRRGRMRGAAR